MSKIDDDEGARETNELDRCAEIRVSEADSMLERAAAGDEKVVSELAYAPLYV